jgi:hypothetical protein
MGCSVQLFPFNPYLMLVTVYFVYILLRGLSWVCTGPFQSPEGLIAGAVGLGSPAHASSVWRTPVLAACSGLASACKLVLGCVPSLPACSSLSKMLTEACSQSIMFISSYHPHAIYHFCHIKCNLLQF